MRRILWVLLAALLSGSAWAAPDAMVPVTWSVNGTLSVIHVGRATISVPHATVEDARRDAPREAARLGLVASTRASLARVTAAPMGQAAALMWQDRIVLVVTRARSRDLKLEPLELAAAWAATLRREARSDARPGNLPPWVTVPLGESRVVAVPSAWIGATLSTSSAEVMSAQAARAGTVVVRGRSPGVAVLEFRKGARTARLEVRVREVAGKIPPGISVQLSGQDPDVELALDALQRALEQACKVAPGAWLVPYWQGVGGRLATGRVRVTAWLEGPGLYPVVAAVAADVGVAGAAFERPIALAASNHPERLEAEGLLLDEKLTAGNTVYYYHHQNAPEAPARGLEVRLENRSDAPLVLLVTQSGAGPSRDELYAGHLATWRYLKWMTRGNGWLVRIPPRGSYVLDRRVLSAREVGCGMGQVMVRQGAPPSLVVESYRQSLSDVEDAPMPIPTPQAGGSIRGRGLFGRPEKELNARYRVGDPYVYVPIGEGPYQEPLGSGTPNIGNYGVEHRIRIRLENPTPEERRVFLVFSVRGGLARGSLLVDDQLIETPMLSTLPGRNREFELARYDLAPGEIREVSVLAFPEPGSNYPVKLVVKPLPANQ